MAFNNEKQFEEALITLLFDKGWSTDVLVNPSEQDLIKNWADILYQNNRGVDCLNNYPLTEGEMAQILSQISALRTPLRLNSFINGKSVAIKRDNPDDKAHFGREVSLKIYDRMEIAAGQSRYQIVRQPKFPTKAILNDRRGDLMLLINGMPVFHIELKKSGIPVSQAANQIEKYSREGIFTGLFSLVQIFVAMTPEETLYFANPGPDGFFNPDYYFHWADFNNEPINDWQDIASSLISIPMAHQLIGFYTIADSADGVLKVMRSYQYYAANRISDKVAKNKWEADNQLGGYIWHTTGSGKTMTSFKSAQLIAQSSDADKVVFLVDRIELGTQTLKEYRGFADDNESVQATENGTILKTKLGSDSAEDTLIVTSIQKMYGINDEDGGIKEKDLAKIRKKRIVFIVDECHRSTFGDMLINIKKTFPRAIFFGFTGTPIYTENQKKDNTTATVFGDELHRYSIADGIRDKNVLGFDPYRVSTYKEKDLRQAVALEAAKANSLEEALADPAKSAIYYKFMDQRQTLMAGHYNNAGKYVKGIEDYIPVVQYNNDTHRQMVAEDIAANWMTLSHGGKFHAIFATSSIPEAIAHYRLLKAQLPKLKITALFDPNIDNENPDGAGYKEDGLVEIISDYNSLFGQSYSLGSHAKFKKDIASRLAHKDAYKGIERHAPDQQLNILIVVNQMLTGFDSKWVNTLYLDKLMAYADIIQAFSRTNRLFGYDKPFGTIRYYRYTFTMERNIAEAVKLYSGEKPLDLFVQRLEENLNKLNAIFADITSLFANSGVAGFERLPDDIAARGRFASLFKRFNDVLEAAKIQGFVWDKLKYTFKAEGKAKTVVTLNFDYQIYLILVLRYQELFSGDGGTGGGNDDVPYDIAGYITEINTGVIDAQYMNSRFDKYYKLLRKDGVSAEEVAEALNELHKTFAALTQEEQKYANIFLHDIQSGSASIASGKTLRDYITELQTAAKNDQIHRFAITLGVNEVELRKFMDLGVTESNINDFGRYDKLRNSVDKSKAKAYFEKVSGKALSILLVNAHTDSLLRKFILLGGFDFDRD